jgi:DNA-binding MarR family transcriptional regulator
MAWFGRNLSFLELMRDLEELIDDHTDYFKGTLEALPPRERKVFVSLARLWANSPVGIIAVEAGMQQPETSAILNRLIKRGIVEEYEEEGQQPVKRGKTYQLTERLFNIFYLMRRGGAEALFVYDVVNFLIQFFYKAAKVNKTETALLELSELLKHPAYVRKNIKSLTDGCIESAAASPEISRSIAETIEESPSKDMLYPLYAGIRLYLGDKMRLPREVREIAKVIRERIEKQGAHKTPIN